jgi:hypothetical protein
MTQEHHVMNKPTTTATASSGLHNLPEQSGGGREKFGVCEGKVLAARPGSANAVHMSGKTSAHVRDGRPVSCSWYG